MDAVGLDLDWTGAKAQRGSYGAALRNEAWQCALDTVAAAATSLDVPVGCKVRAFSTAKETVTRAMELVEAGCSFLAVHGRTCDDVRCDFASVLFCVVVKAMRVVRTTID